MEMQSSSEGVYETRYLKSLRHYLTREALPVEANYRNLKNVLDGRPTLDELHNSTYHAAQPSGSAEAQTAGDGKAKGKIVKFGWMKGVLMVCLLNIWGVMLFLRISWIVGQCGLLEGLGVVVVANTVTLITALSMSAIATNGFVEGGGVYYMLSRSLGPEFGGSIGLLFSLANAIAVATYIIGFVNSLQDMVYYYFNESVMIDGAENDVRAVGTGVLIALLILAVVGMEWVQRAQMGLLVLLIAAQVDFVVGAFMGPQNDIARARGFVGISSEVIQKNLYSDYRRAEGVSQNAASTFAVFFPAVTGITAGANLSGDLKDPSFAIPLGTLLAIAITFCTYFGYPILIAASVMRDASGDLARFQDYYYNDTGFLNGSKSELDNPVYTTVSCSMAGHGVPNPLNASIPPCEFGTHNNFQIIELVSAFGPLIYAGCFAATLSSAIASLTGAPRILQALSKDKLYPGIYFFAKGYGINNDPVRGYMLVFVISLGCIMIGNLNAVSTLLSNFFLASYCLINVSCFHASLIKSPGWRPSFTYYNLWVSIIGGLLCLVVMFLIDVITALVTFLVVVALYFFVQHRKPDVNWGSSTQAATYKSALASTLDLMTVEDHVKNYRPQILVFSGQPSSRPPLIDFAHLITKNISLMACGHISKPISYHQRTILVRRSYTWLAKHKIKAFYDLIEADDIEKGAQDLFQMCGLGKLRPNVVLIGFKTNWNKCERADLMSYFNTLHKALNMQMGVTIMRLPCGINFSDVIEDEDFPTTLEQTNGGIDGVNEEPTLTANDQAQRDGNTSSASSVHDSPEITRANTQVNVEARRKRRGSHSSLYHGPGGMSLPKDTINNITIFKRKQKKGTIDVWWLYDDGGLTILLPFILTTRASWGSCRLRIFTLANRKDELDMEQRSMATLLGKFRIDYDDVIVIPDAMRKAKESSRREFEELIDQFKTEDETGDGFTLTEDELHNQREKTNRHIRLRELAMENSRDANLIVMTLPMPRKNISASLYMAWLDYITKGMPPFLFVRGNQQSVLTFYS